MMINYTWPGRFHLIVNGTGGVQLYVTLWLFKRRFHYMKSNVGAKCYGSTPVSKTGRSGSIPGASAILAAVGNVPQP